LGAEIMSGQAAAIAGRFACIGQSERVYAFRGDEPCRRIEDEALGFLAALGLRAPQRRCGGRSRSAHARPSLAAIRLDIRPRIYLLVSQQITQGTGMSALYTADHEQFRTTCRRFIEREIAPHHAQWEKDGLVSRDLWRKAGAAGLLLTDLPAE